MHAIGRFVEGIIGLVIGIIVLVLMFMLVKHVLLNGAYYGGLLGDMIRGLVDLVQSAVSHATG